MKTRSNKNFVTFASAAAIQVAHRVAFGSPVSGSYADAGKAAQDEMAKRGVSNRKLFAHIEQSIKADADRKTSYDEMAASIKAVFNL